MTIWDCLVLLLLLCTLCICMCVYVCICVCVCVCVCVVYVTWNQRQAAKLWSMLIYFQLAWKDLGLSSPLFNWERKSKERNAPIFCVSQFPQGEGVKWSYFLWPLGDTLKPDPGVACCPLPLPLSSQPSGSPCNTNPSSQRGLPLQGKEHTFASKTLEPCFLGNLGRKGIFEMMGNAHSDQNIYILLVPKALSATQGGVPSCSK